MIFLHINRNTKTAFTLIETIVSITILTIAVVGPMTISARSIHASSEARLSTEATYLAIEAIEIIRNIRDNYSGDDAGVARNPWILGESAPTSIHGKCGGAGGCVVDITRPGGASQWLLGNSGVFEACNAGCTNRVYVKNGGDDVYYRQNGSVLGGQWVASPFTRIVRTAQITANMTRVTVTVTYRRTNGTTATLTMVDDLYNWFPNLVP